VLAWLACAGAPAVLAALGAVGAGSIAEHAYMLPAYAAFLGFSVWLLLRSGRRRGERRPFWLGLTGAALAIGATWLAIVGLAPPSLALWSHAGVAAVVGASVWSFLRSRRPGSCLDEMVREAQLRERRGPPVRRLLNAALASSLVVATLYAMYWSVQVAGVA
ncbi:MAG: methyltransferase domain-containing protein, partial [Burkholderiales bacterium]